MPLSAAMIKITAIASAGQACGQLWLFYRRSSDCGGGKIYAKNPKFCIAAVFVVCQWDNHKGILGWCAKGIVIFRDDMSAVRTEKSAICENTAVLHSSIEKIKKNCPEAVIAFRGSFSCVISGFFLPFFQGHRQLSFWCGGGRSSR